jgi:heme exporter protein A
MRLVVDALAAERGGRTVFTGLSFVAEAGTLLRVSGANGAGKTTLLRILSGLAATSAGHAVWHRAEAPTLAAEAACFVGHTNAFNEALTVRENLTYAAALAGLDPSVLAIESALTALGVKPLINRRFGTLSQGQRKRCSLARLLLDSQRGRRAWLLDEPFVALDVDTQSQLAALISTELSAGGLVIYTSHQAVEIDAANTAEVAL